MTPERWQAIRPILESALELDPEQRPAFLDSACSDRDLRLEVESLLTAHDQAGAEVLQVAAPLRLDSEDEARFRIPVGQRIGHYKILDEIAVGGMGAVYRASRDDGTYRQEVALKIVRTELGGDFGTARFKNERQILASLDHPNIAKILDGGTTGEGIPYLVMELIDGLPITDYCDRQRLTIPARLELFRTVCSAVHYAHQRLVIHRDIKPSNILVTAQGIPKLLDFGIAKILDPLALPEGGALTVAGTSLMTPEYASPEQLLGDTITTATDVYSLGCVLYELLTGRRALRVTSRLPHEIARAVLEKDPEKPSTIVRREAIERTNESNQDAHEPDSIGRLRGETLRKLRRQLQGDLDNIAMRAIRKEPAARYESVNQLSEDLRRHLQAEPVHARKSTIGYQLGKFVVRHKLTVAAAAAIALTVIVGLIVTIYEARVARSNELRAERRFNDVRKLANSLVFEVNDSLQRLPGTVAARKSLMQHAQKYLENLAQESTSDASLMSEVAAAYTRLAMVQGDQFNSNVGDSEGAVESYRRAAALLESAAVLQPASADVARELALTYVRLGSQSEENGFLQKALRILEPLALANPHDDRIQYALAKTYERIAIFLRGGKNLSSALEHYRKADTIYEQLHQAQPQNKEYLDEVSFSHKHIGTALAVQGQLPSALEHYRTALAIDEEQLALNPQSANVRYSITFTYSDTGFILGKMGDFDGAIDYYRKALEIRSALSAADPQDVRARGGMASALTNLGINYERKQNHTEALDFFRKALAIRQGLYEKDSGNERLRADAARSEQAIGKTYAALALQAKLDRQDQIKYCRESQNWSKRALEVLKQANSAGKLPSDDTSLQELAETLASCDGVIASGDRRQ